MPKRSKSNFIWAGLYPEVFVFVKKDMKLATKNELNACSQTSYFSSSTLTCAENKGGSGKGRDKL